MLRAKLTLCAEMFIRDSETQSLSAISILDELNTPQFPFLMARIAVMNLLERDAGDPDRFPAQLSVTVDGQPQVGGPVEVVFQPGRNRVRNIVTLGGVVIARPGTLRIALTHDNQERTPISHYDLTVIAQPPPPEVRPA